MTSNHSLSDAAQPVIDNHLGDPASLQNSEPRPSYDPGHPWYYLPQGDNMPPLPIEQIAPGNTGDTIERDLPKDATKREHKLRKLRALEEAELQRSVARYLDLVTRGADALSDYDRNIAYSGNLEMARASSLALVHNHIAWHKGRMAFIKAELDAYGPLLF